MDTQRKVQEVMVEEEVKAWEALASYDFLMFGYHAAMWVKLNKLLDKPRDNPWQQQVQYAQRMMVPFIKLGKLVGQALEQEQNPLARQSCYNRG